jgi:hypothetical protein
MLRSTHERILKQEVLDLRADMERERRLQEKANEHVLDVIRNEIARLPRPDVASFNAMYFPPPVTVEPSLAAKEQKTSSTPIEIRQLTGEEVVRRATIHRNHTGARTN